MKKCEEHKQPVEAEHCEVSEAKQGLSRRSFLAGSGSVAAAALTAGTLLRPQTAQAQAIGSGPSGPAAPGDLAEGPFTKSIRVTEEPPIPAQSRAPEKIEYVADVLVIGGGFCGLMAAVAAREAGQSVVLMDKGRPGYSGLSCFVSSHRWFDPEMGDNADMVREQMMRGSLYLANMNWVDIWLKESKSAFLKLKELGVMERYPRAIDTGFHRSEDYVGYHESIGDKNRHRRWMKALEDNGIEVRTHTMVTNVIRQNGRAVGAIGFHVPSGAIVTCHAKAVVMCMGSGIYKHGAFPLSGNSYDGVAIGYQLGLPIIGHEFEDFHGGSSQEPANAFAPNGWTYCENIWFTGGDWEAQVAKNASAGAEGAMNRMDTVKNGLKPGDGKELELGAHLAGSKNSRADDIRTGKLNSPLIRTDYIGSAPGMCMHLSAGIFCGVDDAIGSTGIPGLYVAGDGTAGSSITGSAYAGGRGFTSNFVSVQGRRAGVAAAQYAKTVSMEKISGAIITSESEKILEPMNRKKGFAAGWALDTLNGIMAPAWTIMVKSKDRLEAALTQVSFLRDHIAPNVQALNPHDLRICHEVKHKVLEAEMKLRSSLAREESRGSHFREDFPFRDDKNFLCYLGLKKGQKGEMTVNKIAIKDEWKGDPKEDFATRYANSLFPAEAERLHLPVKPRKTEPRG
jgi:succinate dehydrogenase/fumarate reductase flavoprotein subunit